MGARFEVRGARVEYPGTVALAGVDLTLEPGEAVAFVGPSGAGKTSLLRLLGAALHPTDGEVVVAGRPLGALSPRELRRLRASIAFIHQDLRLVPELRVVKNVLAGRLGRMSLAGALKTLAFPSRAEVADVYGILARVGIPDKLYQRTDTLSGGQRQRVAVARALYQQPTALLADEPVSAVDPARARDTVELLVELSRERGLTLVVSLHNLELARELFPRLVGLRHGRVSFDLPSSEISEDRFRDLYDLPPVPQYGRAG